MSALKVLSPRHQHFVQEYCVDRNGTRAYRAAYPRSSEAAARVSACKLLSKANIQKAIEEYRQPTLDELGITFTRIVQEVAKGCFFDITAAVQPSGSFKALEDWPDDLRSSIAALEMSEPDVTGKCIPIKVRFNDRIRCLELLMRVAGVLDGQRPSAQLNPLAQLLTEMGPSMFMPVAEDPDFLNPQPITTPTSITTDEKLTQWVAVKRPQ